MSHEHDIATGKVCKRCGKFYPQGILARVEGPVLCADCRLSDIDPEEVQHDRLARCPACGNTFDPIENTEGEACHEATHPVWCDECEHEFTISTAITCTFTSPARLEDKP